VPILPNLDNIIIQPEAGFVTSELLLLPFRGNPAAYPAPVLGWGAFGETPADFDVSTPLKSLQLDYYSGSGITQNPIILSPGVLFFANALDGATTILSVKVSVEESGQVNQGGYVDRPDEPSDLYVDFSNNYLPNEVPFYTVKAEVVASAPDGTSMEVPFNWFCYGSCGVHVHYQPQV
jgi:hypothetical protein